MAIAGSVISGTLTRSQVEYGIKNQTEGFLVYMTHG
jgi:hypothetical protein